MDRNVPVYEFGYNIVSSRFILRKRIIETAIEKYRSNGSGITFENKIKHFHDRDFHFLQTLVLNS